MRYLTIKQLCDLAGKYCTTSKGMLKALRRAKVKLLKDGFRGYHVERPVGIKFIYRQWPEADPLPAPTQP